MSSDSRYQAPDRSSINRSEKALTWVLWKAYDLFVGSSDSDTWQIGAVDYTLDPISIRINDRR